MLLALLAAFVVSDSDQSAFAAIHDAAMRHARVCEEPAARIEDAKLDRNPEGAHGFAMDEVVECRFKAGGIAGTTPKFDCELPDGESVKTASTTSPAARSVDNWVRAFQAKVRAIVDRAPCPADPAPTATQQRVTAPRHARAR